MEYRSALKLTAKLVPKLMRVQIAIAWPLTRAGKISPIITHEMGPKLICRPKVELCHWRGLLNAGICHVLSWHCLQTACMQRNGMMVVDACLLLMHCHTPVGR